MRRNLIVGSFAVLALVAFGWAASAAEAHGADASSVVIDTLNPKLTRATDGTSTTIVTLTVLNSASQRVTLSDPGCAPEASPTELVGRVSTAVTISFPAGGCTFQDDVISFQLTVTDQVDPTLIEVFNITTQKATPKVDWGPLWYFVWVFVANAVLFVVLFWFVMRQVGSLGAARKGHFWWGARLGHLEATYSFKDSVVTNVTVLAGILTAVLGSKDLLTTIAPDAGGAVALITIGGAISVGMAGAAPVVVQLLQTMQGKVTELGLLLATIVTMTAACGQIVIIGVGSQRLRIADDVLASGVWCIGNLLVWHVIAAILIGIVVSYGLLNLYRTDLKGLTPPKTAKESVVDALAAYSKATADAGLKKKLDDLKAQVEGPTPKNILVNALATYSTNDAELKEKLEEVRAQVEGATPTARELPDRDSGRWAAVA
ncbi:MAG TPA: hypothetical protein VIU11_03540 [Nakamurella sp.]